MEKEKQTPTTKRAEQHLTRIVTLEDRVTTLEQCRETDARGIEFRLMQVIAEQRAEIVRLREELMREHQNELRRKARALTRFKSE